MYIKTINKESFLQFTLDESKTTMENGKIFKVMQNDINYIVSGDFNNEILSSGYNKEVTVFGFVYGGKFYSTYYDTRDIDLNFYDELNTFENKFKTDYEEAITHFSLSNPAPVTDKTKEDEHKSSDFEYYCKYQASDDALRELFEISYKSDRTYNNRKFAPIFFDYLKHPENYSSYIQTAIEENAHIINYRIKCNVEKQKAFEALKNDTNIMYKWNMYQTLKSIDGKTVKMTCTLYGENFELSIERETLMRELWHDNDISLWNFTKTVSGKIEQAAMKSGLEEYKTEILFTDIQKITYGKKVIFEKEV